MKINDEVIKFYEENATKVTVNGHEYYFLPFWLKKREDEFHVFDEFYFDELPEELKHAISFFKKEPDMP